MFTRRLDDDPMWKRLFPLRRLRLLVLLSGHVPSSLGAAVAGSLGYDPTLGAVTWSGRGTARRRGAREVAGAAVFVVVGLVTFVLPLIGGMMLVALAAARVGLSPWAGLGAAVSLLLAGLPGALWACVRPGRAREVRGPGTRKPPGAWLLHNVATRETRKGQLAPLLLPVLRSADAANAEVWLHTHADEKVAAFASVCFQTVSRDVRLGVPRWTMRRPPHPVDAPLCPKGRCLHP